jgi:hypothetical protein
MGGGLPPERRILIMKRAINEIKWIATIHENDNTENGIIKIGIQQYEDDYGDEKFFDLVADNEDEVSQGGFETEEEAVSAIFTVWKLWDTLEPIEEE